MAHGSEMKHGRIEVAGTNVVSLGLYPNTEDRTARIQIKNVGEGPLTIQKVMTTCKCMRTDAFPSSLAPGTSGEVAVSIKKNEVAGAFERVFYVLSDDPETPSLKVRVQGYAKPLFFVTCSSKTILGPIEPGLVWTGTFAVVATETGLSLGDVTVQNKSAQCHFTTRTNRQETLSYDIFQTVNFGSDNLMESTLVFPVVRPNGELSFPVRLTVEAVLKNSVRVVPDRIVLSPASTPCKRRILVAVDTAAPLQADRLTCRADGPGVEVKVSLSKSGRGLYVELTFPPEYAQGLPPGGEGQLLVQYGDCPAVVCPVRIGR